MEDDEVSRAAVHMPLTYVPMMRSALVPEGLAVVLLEREDGALCLAVHPKEVSQQAVDEYNATAEHAGRHGIGAAPPAARPHPAV